MARDDGKLNRPRPATCPYCHETFSREYYGQRYCSIDCSSAVAAENAEQLRSKSGPYYERWRAGMAKAAMGL